MKAIGHIVRVQFVCIAVTFCSHSLNAYADGAKTPEDCLAALRKFPTLNAVPDPDAAGLFNDFFSSQGQSIRLPRRFRNAERQAQPTPEEEFEDRLSLLLEARSDREAFRAKLLPKHRRFVDLFFTLTRANKISRPLFAERFNQWAETYVTDDATHQEAVDLTFDPRFKSAERSWFSEDMPRILRKKLCLEYIGITIRRTANEELKLLNPKARRIWDEHWARVTRKKEAAAATRAEDTGKARTAARTALIQSGAQDFVKFLKSEGRLPQAFPSELKLRERLLDLRNDPAFIDEVEKDPEDKFWLGVLEVELRTFGIFKTAVRKWKLSDNQLGPINSLFLDYLAHVEKAQKPLMNPPLGPLRHVADLLIDRPEMLEKLSSAKVKDWINKWKVEREQAPVIQRKRGAIEGPLSVNVYDLFEENSPHFMEVFLREDIAYRSDGPDFIEELIEVDRARVLNLLKHPQVKEAFADKMDRWQELVDAAGATEETP